MIKHVLYLIVIMQLGACTGNQHSNSESAKSNGKLRFTELSFNFGSLTSGDVVGHRFPVINEGSSPVVIQKVEHGCGCTDAVFPQKPIKPLDTAFVEVIFDTNGWKGRQVKQIVVLADDSLKRHELLIWASIK